MRTAVQPGFVLWAIPRFRRQQGAVYGVGGSAPARRPECRTESATFVEPQAAAAPDPEDGNSSSACH